MKGFNVVIILNDIGKKLIFESIQSTVKNLDELQLLLQYYEIKDEFIKSITIKEVL